MMTVSLATTAPRALAPRGWSRLAVVLPEAMSDEDLLERVARERDQSAFEILYSRYARAIYSLVVRILRDRHTGEDVAQEAFAAVWRAPARGPPRPRRAARPGFAVPPKAAGGARPGRGRRGGGGAAPPPGPPPP